MKLTIAGFIDLTATNASGETLLHTHSGKFDSDLMSVVRTTAPRVFGIRYTHADVQTRREKKLLTS